MAMRVVHLVIILAAGLWGCSPGEEAASVDAAETACGRDCLIAHVERYIGALAAHDPEALPLAADIRYTENGQQLDIGKGLWATASKGSTYEIYVADPQTGEVGLFGVIEENGAPALLFTRLKLAKGEVSEIETMVVREGGALFNPQGLKPPSPVFAEVLPPETRNSRDELIAVADSYFDALESNNGENMRFTDDCQRVENGTATTGNTELPPAPFPHYNVRAMGCYDNVNSKVWSYITEIAPRRYPIVDADRGLVLGLVMFHHDGAPHPVEIEGVGTVDRGLGRPFSAGVAELFKVEGGRIRRIEALLYTVPYGARSGWDG